MKTSTVPAVSSTLLRTWRGWREVPYAKGHAKTAISNFPISPEALDWAPKHVQSLWGAREIFITENGCAGEDVLADDGKVYDTDRGTAAAETLAWFRYMLDCAIESAVHGG